jgi:hypothetical protein
MLFVNGSEDLWLPTMYRLEGRAAAAIQQGYAVAVEDDKPAVKGAKKR